MHTGSDITLKRDSIVTIHDQLVAHFSQQISSGELPPETQLPSENQLAKDLKISRMTVRRVFETLGHAGLVSRRHGKGTYVAPAVSHETGLIGYIGQSLTEGMSSELFSHLSAALEDRKSVGWNLLVCSADNSQERQLGFVSTLMNHDVQGILLTPAVVENPRSNQGVIHALEESGVPFVLVDRVVAGTETDSVVADHFKGGYAGTEYLIGLGHERIIFVDNPPSPAILEMDRGYRTALEDRRLPHSPNLTFRRSDIADRMPAVLASGATSVLAHSDFAARDVLSWCSSNGVDVPGQMAIVGVGDLRHAQGPEPILTTVRKDFRLMADLALDILLQRIERQGGSERRHEIIDVDVLVRKTCGAGQASRSGSKP